ncbi:hypothetical protein [Acinetobacter rathckeae]|uniref:hypothetical protein n=1 Tax=Acinetobacter rathckeae TaxID=2605272 RepID=UPI0018A2A77E|nr:hypothetical protein [Acinetobacter rathckeae]MBF7694555.1 hypothetical protein [Acinetobacter rathckeae]
MNIDFTEAMLNPDIVIAVACLKLNAYKLYPLNKAVRDAYFAKNMLTFLREQNLSININQQELMQYILDTNLPNKWKSIHSGGYAAGSMFIHLISMKKQGISPSLNKAKYMHREWNMKIDRDSLKKYKSKGSIKALTTAWHDFGMVAHIWALEILATENDMSFPNIKGNYSANEIFDIDSRLYIASVKEMERYFKSLNMNFYQLPDFKVGFVAKSTLEWNDENKKIITKYTFLRGE